MYLPVKSLNPVKLLIKTVLNWAQNNARCHKHQLLISKAEAQTKWCFRWVWLCYAQNHYYYTSKHWEMNNVCVMLVYLQNDLISRWFKQGINYIEKANKEHYQQKSESIKPLSREMIHCFEALQSEQIIWFRAGLQSTFRDSFDSERGFKARFANHLFRAGLQSAFRESFDSEPDFKARFANHLFRAGLQSAFRKSFVSERDFKARFANHLIQSRTSKRVSRIIWFRAGLQSTFRVSFVSERDFKARFANNLFPSGTSKRVSRII